jgi:hypothetical protein
MHKPDLISNIQLAGSLYATSTDEMEKQSWIMTRVRVRTAMVLVHFNVPHWTFPTETKENHRNQDGQYPGQNSNHKSTALLLYHPAQQLARCRLQKCTLTGCSKLHMQQVTAMPATPTGTLWLSTGTGGSYFWVQ